MSDFQISGQFLIKENFWKLQSQWWYWHETWTSNETWQGKQNNIKKTDDEVMSANCDVIAMFPIYDQFGAIWKSDSGYIACKTFIFINSNLLSYKNWKQY